MAVKKTNLVPQAFFAFALCTTLITSTAIAAPSIFWISDPVNPDETVLITGYDLQEVSELKISELDNSPFQIVKKPNSFKTQILKPIRQNSGLIQFIVPKSYSKGVYRIKLIAKHSKINAYLNRPTIYWVQGDTGPTSSPGGWIRIFGKNIARSPETLLSLSSATNTGKPIYIKPSDWGLWDASFNLPKNINDGVYKLKLWNGQGDRNTWTESGPLTIRRLNVLKSKTVNLKSYGAFGDGRHDDTRAILAALAALNDNGGGTLWIPRGRYRVSSEIEIPSHVNIEGESPELVSLNWPEFENPPAALLNGFSDISIKNLTIYASNYSSVISGGFERNSDSDKTLLPGNFCIDNLIIRASAYRGHISPTQAMQRLQDALKVHFLTGAVTIRLTGRNLRITNSNIYGSGSAFLLLNPEGAYVAHNQIYNGRGWYSITGANKVIFEYNKFVGADMQSTGGGINTLGYKSAFSKNVLFKNNNFSLIHGWDREAMSSDGPGGYFYGHVRVDDEKRLKLSGKGFGILNGRQSWEGAGIFIISGRGTGEFSTIKKYSNGLVTLKRNLPVTPDESSIVSIIPMQKNYLIIGNKFSDAGVATQFYGTSINHIVAENTSIRTGGFVARGLIYHNFQPSWYIQFLRNKVLDGNIYGDGSPTNALPDASIGAFGRPATKGTPILVYGIIMRQNLLMDNSRIELNGGDIPDTPSINGVIVEENKVTNSDNGIVLDSGVKNFVIRKNKFVNVATPYIGNAHDAFSRRMSTAK